MYLSQVSWLRFTSKFITIFLVVYPGFIFFVSDWIHIFFFCHYEEAVFKKYSFEELIVNFVDFSDFMCKYKAYNDSLSFENTPEPLKNVMKSILIKRFHRS